MTDKELAYLSLMRAPQFGDIYRHYKGGMYVVVCSSIKEDTLEPLVTYRSNKTGMVWTRTLANFTELVMPSPGAGFRVPRFTREAD